jgi:hypothetical protein
MTACDLIDRETPKAPRILISRPGKSWDIPVMSPINIACCRQANGDGPRF